MENKTIKLSREKFSEFMKLQRQEIEAFKWIRSEEAGHDLGNCACIEWIDKFAESFYNEFIKRFFGGEK